MKRLSDIKIPTGCTHWCKRMKPDSYRFYKVYGANNEIVYIWFMNKWMKFERYQKWVIENTPLKSVVKLPDFNNGFFNRNAETANDKLKRIGER